MISVYLAGGMREDGFDWRDRVCVVSLSEKVNLLRPKISIKDPKVYVQRDLFLVSQADVVLGFMDKENPSGIGMAAELGYAVGLGKHVVTVVDEDNHHHPSRRLRWIAELGDIEFATLVEACEYIRELGGSV